MSSPRLMGIILCYNNADQIEACIESLRFTDAILVFDSGSTDHTVQLAQAAGAIVQQRPFDNYAAQRNAALEAVQAKTDWVLFLDHDERVTPALAQEVRQAIQQEGYAGWRIPRHNYIFGKLTKGAGWYPDYQTRLLKIGAARYDPLKKVHEVVVLDAQEGTLNEPLVHDNYPDVALFHRKQQKYSAIDAKILYEQGIRPKPYTYFTMPLRHFYWRFVTLKGYQDGVHGLRLSLLMAWYEFRKYQQLGRLWRG